MSSELNNRVAVVGCGNWGRNIVRNIYELKALAAVCDNDTEVAKKQAAAYNVVAKSFLEIKESDELDGIIIAAPAEQHYTLAKEILQSGKHVFVEKPLALKVEQGEELCELAAMNNLILMVGHLLQYHPVFVHIKNMVSNGELGRLQYIYSHRLNLGKVRREENILWSFAPHDISMILSLIGDEPESVYSSGSYYLHKEIADVTITNMTFSGGENAHIFVSWLHPFKEQKLVVVGDQSMLVFDDQQSWDNKLIEYPHHIKWKDGFPVPEKAEGTSIIVEPSEPLRNECNHFLECINGKEVCRTDGEEGLRVLRVLNAAENSMQKKKKVATKEDLSSIFLSDVYINETAVIDQPCVIGAGTKIWHFSHILKGSDIGENCIIGQNVMIGPDVQIGNNCKIQNNVSIYNGISLDDGVFCGPSCVFTNVNSPRADIDKKDEFLLTHVGQGASIGANATIICGNNIGQYSFIAAGAVVSKDVPPHALVAGVPANRIGWVSHAGERLGPDLVCPRTGRKYIESRPDCLEEIKDDRM